MEKKVSQEYINTICELYNDITMTVWRKLPNLRVLPSKLPAGKAPAAWSLHSV